MDFDKPLIPIPMWKARKMWTQIIDRATNHGERFVITHYRKRLAVVVSYADYVQFMEARQSNQGKTPLVK